MSDPGSLRNLVDECEELGGAPWGTAKHLKVQRPWLAATASALRGAADRIEQLEALLSKDVRGEMWSAIAVEMHHSPVAAVRHNAETIASRAASAVRARARALLDEQETPDMTRASLVQIVDDPGASGLRVEEWTP